VAITAPSHGVGHILWRVTTAPTRDDVPSPWAGVRDSLRKRGMRWTPQRRLLIGVLADAQGHVTCAELIERCKQLDPGTIPSTVYRTMDMLEELGYVSHAHGVDGREEYHVLPSNEHGHLHCIACGTSWELDTTEVEPLVRELRASRGFEVDLSHVSVSGRCQSCAESD
jgi:Fur family ferric uptake transcriptional regulator